MSESIPHHSSTQNSLHIHQQKYEHCLPRLPVPSKASNSNRYFKVTKIFWFFPRHLLPPFDKRVSGSKSILIKAYIHLHNLLLSAKIPGLPPYQLSISRHKRKRTNLVSNILQLYVASPSNFIFLRLFATERKVNR